MKASTVLPVAVLVSGGLDSSVLMAELASQHRDVYPLFIRQFLRWENVELFWLRRFIQALHAPTLKPLIQLDLPVGDLYGEHWSTGYGAVPAAKDPDEKVGLPGRNILLISKAAVFCAQRHIPELALGTLAGNPFSDARPEFLGLMAEALSKGLAHRLQLHAPYGSSSKSQIITRGRSWPLEKTFSCLDPKEMFHCGVCNKCAERKKAFASAGVRDKTPYAMTKASAAKAGFSD